MDDRSPADAVTNDSQNFVTSPPNRLSMSMVWTGLALHG
jgi:hypothetical protein